MISHYRNQTYDSVNNVSLLDYYVNNAPCVTSASYGYHIIYHEYTLTQSNKRICNTLLFYFKKMFILLLKIPGKNAYPSLSKRLFRLHEIPKREKSPTLATMV